VARVLHTLKLTPTAVTLLGLVGTAGAAYLAGVGSLLLAGVALTVASVLDMLDGALARLTDRASRFGAALDSVADRLSEAVLLLGVFIFYLHGDNDAGATLAFVALVTSYMVSYIRARGEGLGITMKDSGLGTRTERVVIMIVGLVTGWVTVALGVVIALSAATSAQRMYHLWREAKG
jgi:CDP-diacylglycerol--glycerol-3-phosphate 3-phosphatidyltransferase